MKPTEITVLEVLARLGIAAILGVAIGFERQWRQRAAGLHTSGLVSIGAALFASFDAIVSAGDTTRIVAGVVTGVGFLAGSVIFRSGFNVTGLNTATTIWATAGVGALAGFGIWWAATAGAIGIILLNLLLQPVADRIDARAGTLRGETIYKLTIICRPEDQSAASATILNAVGASPLKLQSLAHRHAEGNCVELNADIFSVKPEDTKIEELSTQLLSLPGVNRAGWRSAGA